MFGTAVLLYFPRRKFVISHFMVCPEGNRTRSELSILSLSLIKVALKRFMGWKINLQSLFFFQFLK